MHNPLLQLFLAALLVVVSTVSNGCAGVNSAAPSFPGHDWKRTGVYLPFVESVDIPASVTSGQPFDIVLHVSAQANPQSLAAVSDEFCSESPRLDLASGFTPSVNYLIRPWSDELAPPDDDPDTVTVRMTLYYPGPPGMQIVGIQSAPSRETGGMLGYFYWHPWRDLSADGFKGPVYQYYEIEVLPADVGGI